MCELVTGDAVVLGLRPAKLPSRALAVLIDLTVLWSVYLVLTVSLLTAASGLDEAAGAAVAVAVLLLVLLGGPVAVETLSHGRSLGKVVCGLRVVREDGGPVRFRHALARGAIGFLEIQLTFGVVATLASLVSARGRRLGDVFGGTLVVRERTIASTPSNALAPQPPSWVSERLGGIDLSAVPDSLWLAVRQYLMRSRELDPQVGHAMAVRLAADVADRTGTPVPADVPAFAYLSGVLAERQARDARRAFGEARYGTTDGTHGEQGFVPTGESSAGSDHEAGWKGEQRAPQPGPGSRAVEGERENSPVEPPRSTGFVPPA